MIQRHVYDETFVGNDFSVHIAKNLYPRVHHQWFYFLYRCASDTTVQFISVTQSHKIRFSFMSFKFYGYAQVYLHCQIFMCHKQSSDSRCSSGCQGNNIKRVRRSVTLESEKTGLRSVRRRDSEEQESKNYPPLKTYSLNIGPFVKNKDTETGKWFNNQ